MENQARTIERLVQPEYFFWVAFLLACSFFLTGQNSTNKKPVPLAAAIESLKGNPYDTLELLATSVFVYDVRRKKTLFEKEAEVPQSLASLTKIMTAQAALELLVETTLITIDAEDLDEEGDSGLTEGEVWPLRDLISFMLLKSSNDAAAAIARTAGRVGAGTEDGEEGRDFFVSVMNRLAAESGLFHTRFQNPTGLDTSFDESGAVGTAREMSLLLARMLSKFPALSRSTTWSELTLHDGTGSTHQARNTNTYV